jgi:hypothetical protein
MRIDRLPYRPICLAVTVAMVVSCSGTAPPTSQTLQPSQLLNTVRSHDLLYLADRENNVYVYSYPQMTLEETLTRLSPGGLCADTAGDVYVTNFLTKAILEYAHGGTSPIAQLGDLGNRPTDCSVDPRTGNLAVVNAGDTGLSIYKQARGTPTIYTYHAFQFYYCGYDDTGNLYVDGFGRGSRLLRLPYASRTFVKMTLDRTIHWPGGVRWNGRDLVISDQGLSGGYSVLYRFAIQGNSGTTVGSAPLLQSLEVPEFLIDGSAVIAPDTGRESGNSFRIWQYPHGGKPLRTLSGFSQPIGATISKAR